MERTVFLGRITQYFRSHRIVGILGSRQCGKTTLARDHIATLGNEAFAGGDHGAGGQVHYFDLEDPEHLGRLTDPKLALESLEGLIVIDEIQRRPELFPLLRVLIDRNRPKQRYLILGSASRDLIRQSSETLAGRIIYLELPPFTAFEADDHNHLWLRGGYPPAYLAGTDSDSIIWRKAYVTTFLERDLPAMGIDFAAGTMRRFWMMVAHWHGNILNASEFARSLDVSSPTIRRYLDILDGTFVTRTLQPWYENIRKRQVKSPKILFRDSGILHALLNLPDEDSLRAHPKLGASVGGVRAGAGHPDASGRGRRMLLLGDARRRRAGPADRAGHEEDRIRVQVHLHAQGHSLHALGTRRPESGPYHHRLSRRRHLPSGGKRQGGRSEDVGAGVP